MDDRFRIMVVKLERRQARGSQGSLLYYGDIVQQLHITPQLNQEKDDRTTHGLDLGLSFVFPAN